jgi:hypothetical protein
VLIVSMSLLPSCAPEPPASPLAIAVAPAETSGAARRAEILRQIRAICPTPMTAAELTAAADYLEAHPDALALVGRLNLMDQQSRICRGGH